MGAIFVVLQVARSHKCWGAISTVLQASQSRRCWGATRLMRSGVTDGGAICGWGRWCDLGLGVVVLQAARSLLALSLSLLFSKFGNHLKVK